MTRQQGFDVRVAPEVRRALHEAARSRPQLNARFTVEMRRLSANGTRSRSARKLTALDLWEVRLGDYRAFSCPVAGSRRIAVGALVRKDARKLRMSRLQAIERDVHHWRDRLREDQDEVGGP